MRTEPDPLLHFPAVIPAEVLDVVEDHGGAIALALSCIHLSQRAPVARCGEPDWFEVMKRNLFWLHDVKKELSYCPILCAGDIFDKWNPSPELVNFALDYLPEMYAVPGQHDLPYHVYEDIHKTGFGVLMRAGKVIHWHGSKAHLIDTPIPGVDIALSTFPWGAELTPFENPLKQKAIPIALAHKYCWATGYEYPGAPAAEEFSVHAKKLQGYRVAIFGDNHQSFSARRLKQHLEIFNCGTFMVRKLHEISYNPRVGIICADGWVIPLYCDTSRDIIMATNEAQKLSQSATLELELLEQFLGELENLGRVSADFKGHVSRVLKESDVSKSVHKLVLRLLEE